MRNAVEKIPVGWLLALLLLLGTNPAVAQRPIKTAETVPGGERWLSPGDQLQVRLTGEPGGQATFLNGRPLLELPTDQAGGQRGIYQGSYTITAADTLVGLPANRCGCTCACPMAATTPWPPPRPCACSTPTSPSWPLPKARWPT